MTLKELKNICKQSEKYGGMDRVKFVQQVHPKIVLQLIERVEKMTEAFQLIQWNRGIDSVGTVNQENCSISKDALLLYGFEVPLK